MLQGVVVDDAAHGGLLFGLVLGIMHRCSARFHLVHGLLGGVCLRVPDVDHLVAVRDLSHGIDALRDHLWASF